MEIVLLTLGTGEAALPGPTLSLPIGAWGQKAGADMLLGVGGGGSLHRAIQLMTAEGRALGGRGRQADLVPAPLPVDRAQSWLCHVTPGPWTRPLPLPLSAVSVK